MNEQINVLKPYDVYGDNLQSLFRTVDWLQDHTKRHVFDTKNLKVLSYYSARKLDSTYEVSFFVIDPLYPFVQYDDTLKFDKEIMTVNGEVYDMICESGLIFKINSQIFVVDKKAFASIGSLLDCHGRMLYNGWIGRDLCIADAIADMDHMDLIYRENDEVKYVIAVLGEKQVYNPMRESIKKSFTFLPTSGKKTFYKWRIKNDAFYIWIDYPKYQKTLCDSIWDFGIMICKSNLERQFCYFHCYARCGEVYIILYTEKIHLYKKNAEKKNRLCNQFSRICREFYKKLYDLQCGIDGIHEIAALLHDKKYLDLLLSKVNMRRLIGSTRYKELKDQIWCQLSAENITTVYYIYWEIIKTGYSYMKELNDRYQVAYMSRIKELPDILKQEFVQTKRKKDALDGQISIFECIDI